MPAPGEHHPAFEEYCECIFELHEDDVEVIQARIAERLNVSRPAVSEMIRRLADEGLIDTEGGIALTAAGVELAQRVVRRHRGRRPSTRRGESATRSAAKRPPRRCYRTRQCTRRAG